jgi:hypothetical protein
MRMRGMIVLVVMEETEMVRCLSGEVGRSWLSLTVTVTVTVLAGVGAASPLQCEKRGS